MAEPAVKPGLLAGELEHLDVRAAPGHGAVMIQSFASPSMLPAGCPLARCWSWS